MARILIVDDNEDLRFLLRAILEEDEAGYEIEEAASGTEALERLSGAEPPDLVVLDVQMPRMSGVEVLRRVRADARTEAIPVVMCTVKGEPTSREIGWEEGCDGYIGKPFDPDQLTGTVGQVLELRRGVGGPGADRGPADRGPADRD